MEESNMETTNVQQVDVDLDEIFNGAPGASSLTLPSTEEKTSNKPKPNVFSRNAEVDLGFLDIVFDKKSPLPHPISATMSK